MISNFWVETGTRMDETIRKSKFMNCTGRYSPLSQNLWRASPGFRDNLNLLLTQKSVELVVDEHINFLRCLTTLFSVARLAHDQLPAMTLFLIPVFGVSCIILVI
jgi:hypothetical protein